MKTLKWSSWVMLVTGVGVSTTMLLTRSTRPLAPAANDATDANEQNQAVERDQPEVYQSASFATVPNRKLAPAIPLTPDKTDVPVADITSEPANVVKVRADQVLAEVNGKPIQLNDLVPLEAQETEKTMTPEEYESRLSRAIEMELTFQAAAAGGVDLTPEQKRRVDGVAQRHEATLQEYRKQGFTWSSVTPAQVEFEKRLISALMLQQNLVAKVAHVAPAADANVQLQYEQARSEVLSRLRALGNITVSIAEL